VSRHSAHASRIRTILALLFGAVLVLPQSGRALAARAADARASVRCISWVATRDDPWDDAERAYNEFESAYKSLRTLDKTEVQALVTAICDADEEDRRSVSSDAQSRARDHVRDSYDKLQQMRDRANDLLKTVLADTTFQSKFDRARDYQSRISEMWASIDRMTANVRGGNHPVVAYLAQRGIDAHGEYEHNSSNCTVYEWTLANGRRVDCIKVDGTTAYVFEIKPDNSRARSSGRIQVGDYVKALNNNPEELQRLKQRDSHFNEVTTFVGKLALYRLCPEITDDGEFKEVSTYWMSENP
jgi:hypothetical protein